MLSKPLVGWRSESALTNCCILICRCTQKHNDAIITSRHSSLEKYTSHFIKKGCVWEGVGDRTKTATYWPPNSSGYHSLSFLFSWAAQLEAWGASLCWDMVLIPAPSLQLTWTSCRRGYIIIWHPPTSCECHNFTLNSTPQGHPWSPDIFDWITQRLFYKNFNKCYFSFILRCKMFHFNTIKNNCGKKKSTDFYLLKTNTDYT